MNVIVLDLKARTLRPGDLSWPKEAGTEQDTVGRQAQHDLFLRCLWDTSGGLPS